MTRDRFPPGVAARLQWYVYRLIDPRTGETFYVGKGKGDRVFEHARAAIASTEEDGDLKLRRVREIRSAGLEVAHVIHHHAIDDEAVAFRIETAVMDCFPGLTNRISGHLAEYGAQHVEEIVAAYAAEDFVALEPLIAIAVNRTHLDMDIYDSVRAAWRIDVERARTHRLVLAVAGGLVRGAFRPSEWLPATAENFPFRGDMPGRWGFVGEPAEQSVWDHYVGKAMPAGFAHSQNPIRFIAP